MTSPRAPRPRAGYALLAVLWLTMGIAALAFSIAEAARAALATSGNRIAMAQATWSARGCMAQVRASIAHAFPQQGESGVSAALVWHRMGHTALGTPLPAVPSCHLSARATGSRLDINTADPATITRLLRGQGVPAARADSATAAAVSRRPFARLSDVLTLDGFASVSQPDSLLEIDSGPVALNQAPPGVLLALPGFTAEAVARVMEARATGRPYQSFLEISQALAPAARDSFAPAVPVLAASITFEPVAWVITARSTAGRPPVTVALELQIGHSGGTVGITRRRSWIE